MKFKVNVFNLIMGIMFILAFTSLLLSYVTKVMYIPASFFFLVGFVMLSIKLLRSYVKANKDKEETNEAIVMELASGDDGETYVMQGDKENKKQRRQRRVANFDRLLPSIFAIICSCLFCFLLISSIIKL